MKRVGVVGERWSISVLVSGPAIQQRRLSTSSRFKLTTINGIFLLSHSIRFPFSWLLFDCPSEAFSTGLLNNATPSLPVYRPVPPPHPAPHLPPSAAFTSSVPSESSLHQRQGTMTYFILRNVHHPPRCFPPHPPIIQSHSPTDTPLSTPTFLI